MTQQTSPFLEGKYGWNFGESGWNVGMDENLLKFSFLFDKNIDGIVSSLPSPVNGEAYFLTTDNTLYYAVQGTFYFSPCPKWFILQIKATGELFQFNGSSLVSIPSPSELDTRVTSAEVTIANLGSAAFEDTAYFVSSSDFTQFETDLAGANGNLVGIKNGLANSQVVPLNTKSLEMVSVKDFGAVGDGVFDNTTAFNNAIASGAKKILIPSGIYNFATGPTWQNMAGISFKGDSSSSSIIQWDNGNLSIKSPTDCSFIDIGFNPVPNDLVTGSSYTPVWVTHATRLTIERCSFKGFGSATTQNKAGSTCLYVYAGDVSTAYADIGSTKDVKILDCYFDGDNRKTNFGVRVYTEFGSPSTAENTGCIVQGCTFDGFNWNAVEIAGLRTSNVLVNNCVANSCGLGPFDLDKGVHHCIISNVTINRLLGNIDLVANPNTRVAVIGVQGVLPDAGYSYGNIVSNVTAYLRKTDLDTYGNGAIGVLLAYCHSNIITDINIYCDGVPVRGSGKLFGFAVATFETASNNNVKNIRTTNASSGIVQTAIQNAAMTSSVPNIFENISNIGTLTGEILLANLSAQAGAFIANVFKNIRMSTDLSNPFVTTFSPRLYAINVVASGSSAHYVKITSSEFSIPANANFWLALDQISNLSLEDVSVNDGGAPLLNTRFIHSEGSAIPINLGLYNVRENFGRLPLNLSTALQNLDQTTLIYDGLTDTGLISSGKACMFSSAQPSFPPAANWNSKIERITKVVSSFEGWINIGGAWKTYGVTSA